MKKNSKIRPVSETTEERNKQYSKLRLEYLFHHSRCEVCNTAKAVEIHHKARRKGLNLFRFFLAVCPSCHDWIHSNSQEAKRKNLIFDYDPKEEDETKEIYSMSETII